MAVERESQYTLDVFSALAERTIKRLWVLIIILVLLLFGTNAAWIVYESQFQTIEYTQEVEQDADSGTNNFVGGDYYGASESSDTD